MLVKAKTLNLSGGDCLPRNNWGAIKSASDKKQAESKEREIETLKTENVELKKEVDKIKELLKKKEAKPAVAGNPAGPVPPKDKADAE